MALAERILDVQRRQPDMLDFLRLVIGESGRFPELARGFVAELDSRARHRVVQAFSGICDAPALKARIFMGTLIQAILFQDILHGDALSSEGRKALAQELVDTLLPETTRAAPQQPGSA